MSMPAPIIGYKYSLYYGSSFDIYLCMRDETSSKKCIKLFFIDYFY